MKPPARAASSEDLRPERVRRGPARAQRTQRESIALCDPTECLLEAYDCVAQRAYEKFVARGLAPGGEVEDWLTAEREVLLSFPVNIEESDHSVYALASVPGATGPRVSVGIESRWLMIVVHPEPGDLPSDPNTVSLNAGRPQARSACVVELPAGVEPSHSIAVLADGVLGIRMPKTGR